MPAPYDASRNGPGVLFLHGEADCAVPVTKSRLINEALRTLDAVHLKMVKRLELERVATADRIMANAARALGLDAARFY